MCTLLIYSIFFKTNFRFKRLIIFLFQYQKSSKVKFIKVLPRPKLLKIRVTNSTLKIKVIKDKNYSKY